MGRVCIRTKEALVCLTWFPRPSVTVFTKKKICVRYCAARLSIRIKTQYTAFHTYSYLRNIDEYSLFLWHLYGSCDNQSSVGKGVLRYSTIPTCN